MRTKYIRFNVWNVAGAAEADGAEEVRKLEDCGLSQNRRLETEAGQTRCILLPVRTSASWDAPEGGEDQEGQEDRGDNVVDLEAWKAAREDALADEDQEEEAEAEEEDWDWVSSRSPEEPRDQDIYTPGQRWVLFAGELAASLAVIGVAAALVIRILFL